MTTHREVDVRVSGDEVACRTLLEGLRQTATVVGPIEGPVADDSSDRVYLTARVIPRPRTGDPGEP
jgi:hypothetical protein